MIANRLMWMALIFMMAVAGVLINIEAISGLRDLMGIEPPGKMYCPAGPKQDC